MGACLLLAIKNTVDKNNPKNYYEWMILCFITGFFSPYSLYIYTLNNYTPYYLLPISIVLLFISLIASAKSGLFNIFKEIRKIPPEMKKEWKYAINDYKYWKKFGTRFKR